MLQVFMMTVMRRGQGYDKVWCRCRGLSPQGKGTVRLAVAWKWSGDLEEYGKIEMRQGIDDK